MKSRYSLCLDADTMALVDVVVRQVCRGEHVAESREADITDSESARHRQGGRACCKLS